MYFIEPIIKHSEWIKSVTDFGSSNKLAPWSSMPYGDRSV